MLPGPEARRTLDSVRRALAPRFWGLHLLVVVLTGIAVWLGMWQLGGWQEQRAAAARDLTGLEPVPVSDVLGPDDPFPGTAVGRPVTLAGSWVPGGTVFVSGRESEGREGYWVVTPLEVAAADGDSAMLVVRGWTADPESAPAAPAGPIELVAWLQPPEGTGAVDTDPTDDILPQLRIADAIQHLDQDLYGAYAVRADDVETGLDPATLDQLPDADGFIGWRNLFYALQWWLFGAFVVFVWWRHLVDTLRAEDAVATPSEPADDHVTSTP